MPGVWIDKVYNNSQSVWYLTSVDEKHNGGLYQNGRKVIELDGGQPHAITPGTYEASWCGVPWSDDQNHYKCVSRNGSGSNLFMAQQDGKNWVLFLNAKTGRFVARVEVSPSADSHVNLRFEDDGVYLDVIDAPDSSGLLEVLQAGGPWVGAAAAVIAAAIGALA
jgi:hypothetical protein